MYFLLNVYEVYVSCRILYSFVVYLFVSGSRSITSNGEERANLSESAVIYLHLCGLGPWDGLPYFIVALPEPSI